MKMNSKIAALIITAATFAAAQTTFAKEVGSGGKGKGRPENELTKEFGSGGKGKGRPAIELTKEVGSGGKGKNKGRPEADLNNRDYDIGKAKSKDKQVF